MLLSDLFVVPTCAILEFSVGVSYHPEPACGTMHATSATKGMVLGSEARVVETLHYWLCVW